MEQIKILIVDDHRMVRDGLRSMLESQEKKYRFIIDEAESAEEGLDRANRGSYDVIIMDYQLPKMNGSEATKAILEFNKDTKILALSNYDEYMYITNILKAGARGFVLKNIGPDELINAIETIISGKNYYSNDVAIRLINPMNDNGYMPLNLNERENKLNLLSKREIEILKLIACEFTNEEIANKLFISKRTVDTHRQNLLNKLNVKNTAGLVKHALELNIME